MKRAPRIQHVRPQITAAHSGRSGKVGLVVALAMLGAVLFFAWRRSAAGSGDGAKPMTVEDLYRTDSRVKLILTDCDYEGSFEADTTDVPGILATKLDAGAQLEPLKRARIDLAAMGDRAADALQRVFQNAMGNEWKPGVVKNILGVCALSESNFGTSLALEALRHTAQDVRGEALTVLTQHPDPKFYDTISAVLEGFRSDVHLQRVVRARHPSDPERFAGEIEGGIDMSGRVSGFIRSSLVDTALPLAAASTSPEVAETFLRLERETEGLLFRHHSYLLAPSVRQGNEASLQTLRDSLASPEPQGRYHALRALEAAGRVDEGYVLVETGETPVERGTALGVLLAPLHDQGRTDQQLADLAGLARTCLRDEAPEVQEVALRGLLRMGDPEGIAHALRLLQGTIVERALATRA
ncbi:MAG: hypothetical protein AAGG01_09055, partial [Planctomycetota bacterium]